MTITAGEAREAWWSRGAYVDRLLRDGARAFVPVIRPMLFSYKPPDDALVAPSLVPVAEFRYETGYMDGHPERLERVVEVQTGVVVMGPRPVDVGASTTPRTSPKEPEPAAAL